MSYSIDMLLKSAFSHELRCGLNTIEIEYQDEAHINVVKYLEKRIRDIDREHNEQTER
jgi:hypothetical protein